MRAYIFAIFIGLAMTPCFAETPGGVDINAMAQESQSAAKASLSTLGKLVTEKNAAQMGFARPGDVKQAQLDLPLSDFIVRLDSLREYQQGKDPMSLLTSTGQVIYPVKVGGAVRSSITLRKQDSKWQAVSFGAPVLSKALDESRTTVAKRDMRSASDFFQVRILAFNLVFVGHVENGKLMLTSVADVEMFGVKKGATQPAEEIFLRLKPLAEQDEGLPR